MTDFGLLPPETTSALIHSGPGAGSLIYAAGEWQLLGTELEQSVRGITSALSELTGAWRGPSATAMAQAVEPYLAWLRTTATQCQQVGSAVEAVVAAFESTHWTVVHPLLVTANRTRLAVLVATNWFETNLPAIADTEAEYAAMWVNNSTAMYRYAAASVKAIVLPRFSSPPLIANATGLATQSAGGPAASAVSPTASPTAATLTSTLTSILDQLITFDPNAGWFGLIDTWANQGIAAGGFPVNMLAVLAQTAQAKAWQSVGTGIGHGLSEGVAALQAGEAELASALRAAGSASAPSAALGVGVSMGKLTLPPAVVGFLHAAESPVQLASAASPLSSETPGSPLVPVPPARTPSRASGGSRRREGRDYENIEYGWELSGTVMQRPPSAG